MGLVHIYDENNRLIQMVCHHEVEFNSAVFNTLRFVWQKDEDFDNFYEKGE